MRSVRSSKARTSPTARRHHDPERSRPRVGRPFRSTRTPAGGAGLCSVDRPARRDARAESSPGGSPCGRRPPEGIADCRRRAARAGAPCKPWPEASPGGARSGLARGKRDATRAPGPSHRGAQRCSALEHADVVEGSTQRGTTGPAATVTERASTLPTDRGRPQTGQSPRPRAQRPEAGGSAPAHRGRDVADPTARAG
jgi:hypothetical protein